MNPFCMAENWWVYNWGSFTLGTLLTTGSGVHLGSIHRSYGCRAAPRCSRQRGGPFRTPLTDDSDAMTAKWSARGDVSARHAWGAFLVVRNGKSTWSANRNGNFKDRYSEKNVDLEDRHGKTHQFVLIYVWHTVIFHCYIELLAN